MLKYFDEFVADQLSLRFGIRHSFEHREKTIAGVHVFQTHMKILAKNALHDFFLARSLDALRPGGILALVTSHFTLDKQNAAARELLASQADFLGAIRLPSDAFKQEGTRVVTEGRALFSMRGKLGDSSVQNS